jgi:hypothetical protein
MTFAEAYYLYGCDVERIAKSTGLTPPSADRLVSRELDRRYYARFVDEPVVDTYMHEARG